MRIVIVNYEHDTPTGDPSQTLARHETAGRWAEAVAEAGADVTVAWRFSCDAEIERRGVRHVFRRDAGGPMAWARTEPQALHEAVTAARPDLVHVNGLMFPSQVRHLRTVLPSSCAVAVQDHAGVRPDPIPWWRLRSRRRRRAMREGLRSADAFLFTSDAQGRAWRDAGVIPPGSPIHAVVESSTALRAMDREAARRASGIDGAPAVLWVGRLNENKDPLIVLEGFERAVAERPGARLWMVFTDAPLLGAVRDRVRGAAALSDRVRLLGSVEHGRLAAFYSAADLFVLGSHHEGSGYALVEALACGCVPVVTDVPPFRAITGDGSVGALWPVGDAARCAEALVRLARGDLAAARAAATAHFERRLSWPVIGRRALDIYREVGTARKARGRERSG